MKVNTGVTGGLGKAQRLLPTGNWSTYQRE